MTTSGTPPLPRWADVVVLPIFNIMVALFFSGLLVFLIGEDPIAAMGVMIKGAFFYPESLGYTLFYATSLIFTGLCVAVAFRINQFNIGGEGQLLLGGLGVSLFMLAGGDTLPLLLIIPLAVACAALFGGSWGLIPGYLYAKRGSHIVLTTIMLNFIASALVQYLLVRVLIEAGQSAPQSRIFGPNSHLPLIHEIAAKFNIEIAVSPLNITVLLAFFSAWLVWLLIWRTPWGFALRTVGQSEKAAIYAGINPNRMTLQAMTLAGALAGLVGVNVLLGDTHRLLLGFGFGLGFAGFGVALMGRNHPIGVVLAAILFGALVQGGSELDFEFKLINRDIVNVIQGLIILFAGALSQLFDAPLARLIARLTPARKSTADG